MVSSLQKKLTRAAKQLSSIKKDCSIFSRLYISCQTRDGDLDEFFKYENQGYPPSLSDQGNLRLPNKKSELTQCLEALTKPESNMPKDLEVTIIDGAAVVNMIKPNVTQRTFSDYAVGSFIPYIKTHLSHVSRIDVVWDEYIDNSLKATTRGKRGSGVRQRVEGDNKLPRNWKEFLRVDKNKQELFKFLAVCLSSMDIQKQVISTYGEQIKSTLPCVNVQSIAPCTHEEADTRMLLHAADAVQCGYKKILLALLIPMSLSWLLPLCKSSKSFVTTGPLNSGLVLEQERTTVIFQLMISPTASALKLHLAFQPSMPSQGVTLCPVFLAKERSLRWRRGIASLMSLMSF